MLKEDVKRYNELKKEYGVVTDNEVKEFLNNKIEECLLLIDEILLDETWDDAYNNADDDADDYYEEKTNPANNDVVIYIQGIEDEWEVKTSNSYNKDVIDTILDNMGIAHSYEEVYNNQFMLIL